MRRSWLRWFYIGVQFAMLAVSIPKVASLFHAYDTQTMGPLVGSVDLRSWLVGIAIDLTATFTTWAAMNQYGESRTRRSLIAPALIILFCTGLSVVANYEDAATKLPAQYQTISLFTQSALLVNPILISAPPVLVLLLILLVPSVLAQPRIKTAQEIDAEASEQEALIAAGARVREARARANAQVRSAQVSGLADTFGVVVARTGLAKSAQPEPEEVHTLDELEPPPESSEPNMVALPPTHLTRAMWNSLSVRERVVKSGLINAQEVAEVLHISLARARELCKEVHIPEGESRHVPGRTGVPYHALIESLYASRSKGAFERARKLEIAFGVRKRTRQLEEESVS